MTIEPGPRPPYVLFLGDVRDARYAKTASGVYRWRPDDCIGQVRLPGCQADLGLPDVTMAEAAAMGAQTLVIGLSPSGGNIPSSWVPLLCEAVENGLDIASGMHARLANLPALVALAERLGRRLFDVRSPPAGLPVATGRPRPGKRLLAVGTDCAVGKMFATLAIASELQRRGVAADFRATGQTGILIAGSGICVDAVVADFIAGAAEVLSPDNAPDHWDVIEGQGSLFHPSFAGVSLGLLHGSQPDALVVCHEVGRTEMAGLEGYPVPTLEACIEANLAAGRLVNPTVRMAGICLNTSSLTNSQAADHMAVCADRLGLPVCDPVRTGVAGIVDGLIG